MSNQNGEGLTSRVAQASGMVSVQADCGPSHAIVLMRARAEQTDRTLEQIATAVIAREIRFEI